jgi:hypothetical protein
MQTTSLSESERLYEGVVRRGLEFGQVHRYADLSEDVGRPLAGNRKCLYRAVRLLEARQQRTLVNVANVGYRVAHPNETAKMADRRVMRSQRQIRTAVHTAHHADLSALSGEERNAIHVCLSGLRALQGEMIRVRRRMTRVETRVEELEQRPTLSQEEVAALRDFLRTAA